MTWSMAFIIIFDLHVEFLVSPSLGRLAGWHWWLILTLRWPSDSVQSLLGVWWALGSLRTPCRVHLYSEPFFRVIIDSYWRAQRLHVWSSSGVLKSIHSHSSCGSPRPGKWTSWRSQWPSCGCCASSLASQEWKTACQATPHAAPRLTKKMQNLLCQKRSDKIWRLIAG